MQCGEQHPDLFYTDRPRDGQPGTCNNEYISLFADEEKLLEGRSPLESYADFMHAFRYMLGHISASSQAALTACMS